jgi:hypothetical protein
LLGLEPRETLLRLEVSGEFFGGEEGSFELRGEHGEQVSQGLLRGGVHDGCVLHEGLPFRIVGELCDPLREMIEQPPLGVIEGAHPLGVGDALGRHGIQKMFVRVRPRHDRLHHAQGEIADHPVVDAAHWSLVEAPAELRELRAKARCEHRRHHA